MNRLGFIVEGAGEYNTYPILVSKIMNGPVYCPTLNAGSYGSITCNLEEHLLDMSRLHSPRRIIVTIDSKDPIRAGLYDDCLRLKENLADRAADWIEEQRKTKIAHLLPESITIVIQHQTFESWFVADTEGLMRSGRFRREGLVECDGKRNLDIEIVSPYSYLVGAQVERTDLKKQAVVVEIVKCLNHESLTHNSRSFQKFRREVESALAEFRHD